MILLLARLLVFFFFLMIRRPPRSTLDRSSAASDVYKRQALFQIAEEIGQSARDRILVVQRCALADLLLTQQAVSYTHLRAHETVLDLVCRLLLEKKTDHK
mgnify:CR=1 FL=1